MAIITLRTIIVFFSIYAAMRLMGKRQLGELEPSELVVAVLMTDMAAHPLQDIGIPLLNGLLPIAILVSCELIISWLGLKSSTFRALCFGKPSIMIENGRIREKSLKENRFTLDELSEELRNQGVTNLRTVKSAVLETDGTLNVLLNAEAQPVTAGQMGLKPADPGLPVSIINDGRIEKDNLALLGKGEGWLMEELRQRGLQNPREVYYMTIDALGEIFLQRKDGSE